MLILVHGLLLLAASVIGPHYFNLRLWPNGVMKSPSLLPVRPPTHGQAVMMSRVGVLLGKSSRDSKEIHEHRGRIDHLFLLSRGSSAAVPPLYEDTRSDRRLVSLVFESGPSIQALDLSFERQ